ncbi:TPA: hypothetical protein UM046_004310 [Stenotrophomonas maltophilia]|nr:hypothetical protein [Stenotrophomonas maltophilia]HEL3786494.1 hypothetical protein [Stenotrophomonas maltophilia]
MEPAHEYVLPGTEVPFHREINHTLTSLSHVNLQLRGRAWEAIGLALEALAREDTAEAMEIMPPVSKRRRRGTSLAAAGAPKEEA